MFQSLTPTIVPPFVVINLRFVSVFSVFFGILSSGCTHLHLFDDFSGDLGTYYLKIQYVFCIRFGSGEWNCVSHNAECWCLFFINFPYICMGKWWKNFLFCVWAVLMISELWLTSDFKHTVYFILVFYCQELRVICQKLQQTIVFKRKIYSTQCEGRYQVFWVDCCRSSQWRLK